MTYLVWDKNESDANDLIRKVMRSVSYPYAYRKLNSARFHLIENHTSEIEDLEWTDQPVVMNRDIET